MSKSTPKTINTDIKDIITNLENDVLENETVSELIRGLSEKFPENDLLKKLIETLDVEIERERAEIEYPWILFSLLDTAYSINSKYVLSIEILGEITPIVDAAHYSPGITESRGEMIELIDMLALFGTGTYLDGKAEIGRAHV
jgi:hypothetical protein